MYKTVVEISSDKQLENLVIYHLALYFQGKLLV